MSEEVQIPECPIHHVQMLPTGEYDPSALGQPDAAMRPILKCPEPGCTERTVME